MKTRVCRLYQEHDLRVEEDETEAVGPNDVLVAMARGGICGSDLHYYHEGGFGPIRVSEPIILGHEVSGTVQQVGNTVTDLLVGDRVAVNPSQACGACVFCQEGSAQHCENMRFLGSARTIPHVQGGFRDFIVVDQSQCYAFDASVSFAEAACAEPLAVCLHAAHQAGELSGRRVLVTGAGPIGALCTAVAARAGAAHIVVTDLHDFTLSVARKMGATQTINVVTDKQAIERESGGANGFDVVFECSGAEPAIHTAIKAVRPRGTIVQVGVAGSLSIPMNALVGKEIVFTGSHRFHLEFKRAVELINSKGIDVKPIITQTLDLNDAKTAFDMAGDRSASIKVQLNFSGTTEDNELSSPSV